MSKNDGANSLPKDMRKVARDLRKRGWVIERRGTGHVRWTAPDGRYVMTSSTPGRSGQANALRQIAQLAAGKTVTYSGGNNTAGHLGGNIDRKACANASDGVS